MVSSSTTVSSVIELPVEIILEIYHQLDLNSIFHFSMAHRFLWNMFEQRKATILLPVLSRDFSPFDELLQVFTAKYEDVGATEGVYKPRRIIFRRYPGDIGSVLAPPPGLSPAVPTTSQSGFTEVIKSKEPSSSTIPTLKTVVLTKRDLVAVLKHCQLVKKWEGLFPQIRWFHEPENCRSLRPHEARRFRRALYRWWLYSIYFHGDFPRPHFGYPFPFVEDVRTSQMRYHSTAELIELMDLAETVKDVVLQYICPRLNPFQDYVTHNLPLIDRIDRPRSLLRTGWAGADQSYWSHIVRTYSKLDPEELMYYFENIYGYDGKRLIAEVKAHHPSFLSDQESMRTAIRCALDERRWAENMPSLPEDSRGGIIDFDDERDEERLVFGNDASPDGSLLSGTKVDRPIFYYTPWGDDGSNLNELYREAWLDEAPHLEDYFTGGAVWP